MTAPPFYLYTQTPAPDCFLLGDSFELLPQIAAGSVDLVLLDPPYYIRKDKWDNFDGRADYLDFMGRAFLSAERILRDNGTLAFWHNDLVKLSWLVEWLAEHTAFTLNSWAVWVKPNFRRKLWLNPGENNTLRSWFNICEFLVVFVKTTPGTAWNKTGLALAKLDLQNFGALRDYFRQAQEYTGKSKHDIIAACGQAADHCFRWNSSQWSLPTRETYLDITATYQLTNWGAIKVMTNSPQCKTNLQRNATSRFKTSRHAAMCITLTLRTAMCGKAPSQQPGTAYTAVKNLLTCWNASSAPTPTPAIPSATFSREAAAPGWRQYIPGGAIS